MTIHRTHTAAPPPPKPIRVLGIDPSLTCTGWAVLESIATRPQGLVIAHGYIEPPGPSAGELVERMSYLSLVLGHVHATHQADWVVIERPEDKPRPQGKRAFNNRSTLTLPLYGAAFGVAVAAALEHRDCDRIMLPAPSDWLSKDIPRPSEKDGGDPHKAVRTRYAESVWSLKRGTLAGGVVSKAGNVADACFIARFGLYRAAVAQKRAP